MVIVLALASALPMFGFAPNTAPAPASSDIRIGGDATSGGVLRLYNWGYYIDEDVLTSFAAWHAAQGWGTITVNLTTFTGNEYIYRNVGQFQFDFDVAVPSEYMVSRMHGSDLLIPIRDDVVTALTPQLEEWQMAQVNPNTADRTYAIPYLWGTMGIMFDSSIIRYEYIEYWGWASLFRPIPTHREATDELGPVALTQFAFDNGYYTNRMLRDRIYMKDSVRDSMVAAKIYNVRDRLLGYLATNNTVAHEALIEELFRDAPTDARIEAYRTILTNQRRMREFFKYEVDVGKTEMMEGRAYRGFLGVFWSADAYVTAFNPNIIYHIPREGSNVYVNGMVIPRHATNVLGANRFIYYVNTFTPFRASGTAEHNVLPAPIRNMAVTGSPSSNRQAMDVFYNGLNDGSLIVFPQYLSDYFDSMEELFDGQRVGDRPTDLTVLQSFVYTTLFPHFRYRSPELFPGNVDILNRTSYMRDWGPEMTTRLTLMWLDVQTAGCGAGAIGVGAVLAMVGVLGLGALFIKRK